MSHHHSHHSHSHSHPHSHESHVHTDHRYKETKKITLIGAFTNMALSLMQLLGGFFTHSQALIADGIHTLSDLSSDIIVLVAAKYASKAADEDHPYGHQRYETIATILLGLILGLVGIGIGIEAVEKLLNPAQLIQPEPLALLFAVITIISKESLFYYTMLVAKKFNSPMLKANAWHHRSDAISSFIVLLGVAGASLFSIVWLDTAAAVIVSIMIAHMGLRMILGSIAELVDTAIEPKKIKQIQNFIAKLEGVVNLHDLRTRQMAGRIIADVHVQVDSHISVSEGHQIADLITSALKKRFKNLNDITVHIDPEDDEITTSAVTLASRMKLLAFINAKLGQQHPELQPQQLTVHYLNTKIELEIHLNQKYSPETLEILLNACKTHDAVKKVVIYQKITSLKYKTNDNGAFI